MAEILGLVTAIGTIVATGFKLAQAVTAAADEFGAASNKVKCIATDTSAVVVILRQIRSRLTTGKSMDTEALELLGRLLAQCKTDVDEIQRCLDPLVVTTGQPLTIKQRLRWLYLKEEIQNAVDKTKKTKSEFLNAERFDRAAAKVCEVAETRQEVPQQDTDEQASGNNQARASIDWIKPLALPPGDLTLFHRSAEGMDTQQASSMQNENLARQPLQLLNTPAFDLEEGLSDAEFVNIADHIKLEQAVASLALLVLRGRREPEDESYRKSENEHSTASTPQDKVNVGTQETTARSKSTESEVEGSEWSRTSPSTPKPSAKTNEARQTRSGTTVPREGGSRDNENASNPMNPFASSPSSDASPGALPAQNPAGWPPFYGWYPGLDYNSPPQGYQSMKYPHSMQVPFNNPSYPDHEVEGLRSQLKKLLDEKAKQEEQKRQAEIEAKAQRDAELLFQRRMDEMHQAQEEAKREIEKAKAEAERAARERIEAERNTEEERRRLHEEAMKKAERDARDKLEGEMRVMEAQKKKEAEAAALAEAAAKSKIDAAIKAAQEAKEEAEKKAREELEWRKTLEAEARLKAEIEARQKLENERRAAEKGIDTEKKMTKKRFNIFGR
ncbi:hypothetical protein GQ53DRAFT_844011 [Thozetella sp. PMI_491]|nr:hypothetical protein GQ53DRAFT_844011 [Thozetella sp. PMI_491]